MDSSVALCAQCRLEEFEFDIARAYGVYTGGLRAAILQLKFYRRERLGKKLGELLKSVWEGVEEIGKAEQPLLVPVPLHRSRERERGFNQAQLLAEGLGRKLEKTHGGWTARVEMRCLRRTRATPPQTGLSLGARHENVRGVFAVISPELVRGRVVVLVDDVMTTGATLSACAGVLKRAGAKQVIALVLARATPQFPDTSPADHGVPVDDFGRAWP